MEKIRVLLVKALQSAQEAFIETNLESYYNTLECETIQTVYRIPPGKPTALAVG